MTRRQRGVEGEGENDEGVGEGSKEVGEGGFPL